MRQGCLLALSILTLSVPLGAQIPSSSENFHSRGDARSYSRGAEVLHHMGECVYSRNPEASITLLKTPPGSVDEDRVVYGMRSRLSECINGGVDAMRVGTPELRGAVAEAIHRTRFAIDPEVRTVVDPYATLPPSWMDAYRRDAKLGAALAFHQFAACVVDAAPAAAQKLVRSEPNSGDERAAFGVLVPHMVQCLAKDQKLSGDKPSLRALLAESLYDRVAFVDEVPS